jgi:hypothetical protein
MKEINVKISKGEITFKDKESGELKKIEYVVLEFPNGKSINLTTNRFNYRVYDYLLDTINAK